MISAGKQQKGGNRLLVARGEGEGKSTHIHQLRRIKNECLRVVVVLKRGKGPVYIPLLNQLGWVRIGSHKPFHRDGFKNSPRLEFLIGFMEE